MIINKIKITLVVSLLIALSACQHKKASNKKHAASWILEPESSSISIITTKNNSISEVSEFTDFSGSISTEGKLSVTIKLESLETNIPIRNQRIQDHLFQSKTFPTADIHTQLKPEHLEVGVHSISFDVDFHGLSTIVNADFMVFDQLGKKLITLHKPLIINAKTFGLTDGITTLKNLAFLDSINSTVPVNLVLSFQAE